MGQLTAQTPADRQMLALLRKLGFSLLRN